MFFFILERSINPIQNLKKIVSLNVYQVSKRQVFVVEQQKPL